MGSTSRLPSSDSPASQDLAVAPLAEDRGITTWILVPSTARKRVVILPSRDHMLWHIRKEDFVTDYIFGQKSAKGAIAGNPGKQVWAVWVRRYTGTRVIMTTRKSMSEM
ncbi:hypothetical protein X797_010427 [Metarhizium robertsii]|uniref:LYC1 C-terminal domain-containing protein n=1 Tax=Metarhizium robertsii TaxID=568076 RepID=A0A0A1UN27_9HYPO|nr:hypothetical protein X797_010427 [Metarhizium robertsii]